MRSLKSYKIKLYEQPNKFIERLRWKTHFFEIDDNTNYRPYSTNNYYKFPTSTYAPSNKKLSRFADELLILLIKWSFRSLIAAFKVMYVQISRRYKSLNTFIHLLTRLAMFRNVELRNIRNY